VVKEVLIGDGSTYNNAELITTPVNNYMAKISLPRGALSKYKALWTKVSGASTSDQNGIYGTKGTPAPANTPGAREGAISWTDLSGNLWIFGGYRFDSNGTSNFNDLWRFDGSNWTWISGSSIANQTGVYGTKGTPAAINTPGARSDAVSWTDRSGNLWLFGGYGYDTNGTVGSLNDFWKFDGSNWTWESGANTVDHSGIYGTKGTPAPTNTPGARSGAVSWSDESGNLWLFGGRGFFSIGTIELNDLWKFDGTNWTWVSGGSNLSNQTPVYGSKGVPATNNRPGSRDGAVSWTDQSGNLWLFGGIGYGTNGTGRLNDLWKFDGSNWTWVSGSNLIDQTGSYGDKGTPATTNIPGARFNAVSWTDRGGNLWMFGGTGYDSNGSAGYLNDLWKFDGTNWTWASGSNEVNLNLAPTGAYVASARYHSVSWIDGSGNLWLFGGIGYDSYGGFGYLNDLLLYLP
jgi:N-acetylneuraminic acid mutarotase